MIIRYTLLSEKKLVSFFFYISLHVKSIFKKKKEIKGVVFKCLQTQNGRFYTK